MQNKKFMGGLMLPQRLLKNSHFLNWVGSKEGGAWFSLCGKIVRKKNVYSLPNLVYDEFYSKGKLATGWRLTALAKTLGYPEESKGNVSKWISKLVEKDLVKKRYVVWNKKRTLIYELGYIDPETNSEILYLFEYFTKIEAKSQLDNCKL